MKLGLSETMYVEFYICQKIETIFAIFIIFHVFYEISFHVLYEKK